MTKLQTKTGWLSGTQIAVFCSIIAAIRVLEFAALFPLFNNVDERAHTDLVLKYAHGEVPVQIERYSDESAPYFALYSTPEYFLDPKQEPYGPPVWTLPADEREKVVEAATQVFHVRVNHESGEPPLYYAIAGLWLDFGRAIGLDGFTSLYWVRFLNVAFAIALVWIGFKAARLIWPDQQFPPLAVAILLAIWPQSSFYSIQGDSLSPVVFGIAFIALIKLLRAELPNVSLAVWLGLAVTATCLIKTANLPLLFVVTAAVIFKTAQLANQKMWQRGMSIFAAFIVCVAVPLGFWFAWNLSHFGDLTATKSKIELLQWTPKPFADWWAHPIFTPVGAKDFWAELIASFWRGEFIWHGQRMATWWSDAFYWTTSTVALVIAIGSLLRRRIPEPKRGSLWFALLSFASLVGLLILLSIRFDFRECPYPSRAHPYFTSGRLLNAAAVPFFVLVAYAIERVADWTKRRSVQWILLGTIVVLALGWQLSVNAPVFSSRYNFFHRPATE